MGVHSLNTKCRMLLLRSVNEAVVASPSVIQERRFRYSCERDAIALRRTNTIFAGEMSVIERRCSFYSREEKPKDELTEEVRKACRGAVRGYWFWESGNKIKAAKDKRRTKKLT